jgi:hypothetical protein
MHTHPWYRLEGATAGGRTWKNLYSLHRHMRCTFPAWRGQNRPIECKGTMDDHPKYPTLLIQVENSRGEAAPSPRLPCREERTPPSKLHGQFVHRTNYGEGRNSKATGNRIGCRHP